MASEMSDDLSEVIAKLKAIVHECSPSALPDVRARCIAAVNEKNPDKTPGNKTTGWRPRWWDEYPYGQLVRLAYRVFALVDEHDESGWARTWDEKDEALPPIDKP